MAGVLLQKLIIEATPAEKDQDHLQVVCFTNPQVPDRTSSLAIDRGRGYLATIRESLQLLLSAGATVLVVPCITAHARFKHIEEVSSVPMVNLVDTSITYIISSIGVGKNIGLLATDGTLAENIYQRASHGEKLNWILPSPIDQKKVMDFIYVVKKGKGDIHIDDLKDVTQNLLEKGAEFLLLGCTELSLYYESILRPNIVVIDPLRVVAQELVRRSLGDYVMLSAVLPQIEEPNKLLAG